ncbi:RHS repeat-associated core domain-containing protein [Citrobacter koseri]|uniref:RHS repeat-associated core domain-containing protein n=1 Tax=Citrobacter koseri TaxID=545 RepID=UPI0028BF0FCE|nr:RHS repeat-associated core domain-containing protein [Citrobacter koseri]MDT7486809.1 RHS repeat-associated core domain-containing protein [Citrobacter koseri]
MGITASKHFDPMLGIDFHSYVLPPGIWPTPHISLVFDVMDYVPFLGMGATVKIHGLRRTVAGTEGKAFHILIGVPIPPVKIPGGPQTDDELFMGSKTVIVDGDPLSRRLSPTLSCNVVGIIPPFRLRRAKKMPILSLTAPLTINMALPHHVYVGGNETISMSTILKKTGLTLFKRIGKTKAYKKFMRKFKAFRKNLFKNMEPGFLKCKVLRAEPVDIRDGSVRLEQRDFLLPGRVPLDWIRYYRSADVQEEGGLGYGWKTLADTRLIHHQEEDYFELVLADGALFFADMPEQAGRLHAVNSLPGGAQLWYEEESEGVRHWYAETEENRWWRFRQDSTSPASALTPDRLEDNNGNGWRFRYETGRITLTEYTSQALTGRRVEADCLHQRIVRVSLCDSHADEWQNGDETRSDLTQYDYTPDNQLAGQTDSRGHRRYFAWRERVYMQYHADRLGQRFHYEYDDEWRVIHAWGDGGWYDYRFAWNDFSHELEMTNSLGHTTIIRFSEDRLPLCEIDPEGGATFFLYDEFGQTVSITSPDRRTLRFEYDEAGNICREIAPDDSEFVTVWQALHMKEARDPEGACWRFGHDERGNLTGVTDPAGVQQQYHYDELGQMVRRDTAGQGHELLEYDRLGFVSTMTARTGMKTAYLHDNRGNLLSETNALKEQRHYRYDGDDRLVEAKLPCRNAIRLEYDAEGQLVTYDDGQRVTRLDYTPTGEISGCTLPDGSRTGYEYDTEDQLVAVINQINQRWQIVRDSLGRIVEERDWRGQSTRYQWSADGLLSARTAPDGSTLNYRHDKQGRITGQYGNDTLLARYEYNRRGQLTACDNPYRKLRWRYDSGGRLTEEVQDGFSIRHGYTASGQYAGRESDCGNRVEFGYNDAGQLSRIQINDEPASLLAYDALGRLREEQLTPALKRELSYNENGWLSAQRVSREARPLFSTEWYYDLNGNVRQRNDSVSGREFFSHDVMDRLVQHTDVLGRITHFVYDAAGNRLREDISGSGDEWQCHGRVEEERLVTLEHRYNRNGQLVARKRRTPTLWSQTVVSESLEWDVSGRLTALHSGNASTQYGYDGLGRRVFKKTTRAGEDTANLTWFWWDGDALAGDAQDTAPVEETLTAACDMQRPGSSAAREARLMSLVTGRTVQEYVYYPQSFEPLALIRYGRRWSERDGFSEPEKRIYFYHNDVNGAPLRLTDEFGGMAWSQKAGPWGAWNEQTGSVRNPLRFQGQYFDEESGLHYNRYRYYEPESGRYISADPLKLGAGLNLYAYAPNPLNWIDPLGLSACAPTHHLATNKHSTWSDRFRELFKKNDLGKFKNGKWRRDVLNDPLNKIDVPGHKGPHPEGMHQEIYDRLSAASDRGQDAFRKEIEKLRVEAVTPGTWLNDILTKVNK